MKYLLSIVFLFSFIIPASASTYYFSSVSGDDSRTSSQAQSPFTPWQTINKLNNCYLVPGDSILFNRSETFYGNITIHFSGTSNDQIIYGAYGNGANPIITGLSQLSSWTHSTDNIYYATLAVPALNIVTLDGVLRGMGRFPKTGYLSYTSHSDNTSISGSSVGTLPFDATGAEVVIRKIRQITDRHIITSTSGNTLNYSSNGAYGSVYGNNNGYWPNDGNGYFIQSNINTLTELGDWFYDNTNNLLYMNFGTDVPSDHTIKTSTLDYLVKMDNVSYVTFQNLDFEGANKQAIGTNNNNNNTFIDCNFYKNYNAIFADNGTSNFLIKGGNIKDVLNNGIAIPQMGNNITVDNVKFNNIGYIAGAGGSGDGQQVGLWIGADNSTVKNCALTNLGFHGIVLYGNNTLAEHNYIDGFSNIKDDAGGIYLFGMGHTNQIIRNNTILNAIGAIDGAPPYEQISQASGIYVDNADNVQVLNNVIAHGTWSGIFLVDVGNGVQVKNNLVYDHQDELQIYNTKQLTGLTVTGNEFIAKTALQNTFYVHAYLDIDPSLYGLLDSNIYARPIDDGKTIIIYRDYNGGGESDMTLSDWQKSSGNDSHSSKSPKAIADSTGLRFEFNATPSSKKADLDTNYIDVKGKSYQGTITLDPYSSVVLMEDTAVTDQSTIAIAGPNQTINLPASTITLSGSGNESNGTIASSLWTQISGRAATIISPNSMSSLVTGLSQGSYQFKLTVTGNNGKTGTDSMQIIVNQIILPLSLLTFGAQIIGDRTSLLWATADEKDVSGYDVERMTVNTWTKIGFVPSLNLAVGNYSFNDDMPIGGANFYRLKLVDIDGKFVYSNIITVVLKTNKNIVYQNIPNPFNGITTIRYRTVEKALVKIIVYNESGIQVAVLANETKQPGDYKIAWDAVNIASGNYFYTVTIGNDITTKKMLKIN